MYRNLFENVPYKPSLRVTKTSLTSCKWVLCGFQPFITTAPRVNLMYSSSKLDPYLAGEDTSEGIEAALVLRGDELGDIEHEGAIGVAVADSGCVNVIQRALIQVGHTVLLSLGRRRQMPDHHLQKRLQLHPLSEISE